MGVRTTCKMMMVEKVYENRHKMLCNARTSVIEGGKDVMKGIRR